MEQVTQPAIDDRKSDRRAGIWLGLGFFALYLKTLCPTVYLGDAGEITAAIATGGVVHPPGYPLFSLLGRAAVWLVPWGEPAFRLGCLVALSAALAVTVLFALAREIGASRISALLAAGSFGASFTFWSQSTRVEVYSMHVLLASLVLLAAMRYRTTAAGGWLFACALATSLGVAHHLTIVLLGPAVLVLCGRRLWTDPKPLRRWLPALAAALLGPALYLLLMVWARGPSQQNWGDLVTGPRLWKHATARMYQHLLEIPGPAQLAADTGDMLRLYADNFPYGLFLLPLAGGFLLWKRDRVVAAGLAAAAAVIAIYNYCYTIKDIAGYYLPVWLVLAVFSAVALDGLRPQVERYARPAVAAGLGVGVMVGMPLIRNWAACDLSGATWVREFARQKLLSADPNGILITQGDNDAFPLMYVNTLLRVRPDVVPIDRNALAGMYAGRTQDDSMWYLRALQRRGIAASIETTTDPRRLAYLGNDGALIDLIQGPLKERPLAITFGATGVSREQDHGYFLQWLRQRYELLPVGIVLRAHPKSSPVNLQALLDHNAELWSTFELPEMQVVRTDQELDPAYVSRHYRSMLLNFGGLYQIQGDLKRAAVVYRQVQQWSPREPLPPDAAEIVAKYAPGE